jgi:saccharopine dehydrogenase-like NADP-dependent oxidoreductase
MGRFAVQTALLDVLWTEIVIADLDGVRAAGFVRELGDPRLRALALDVTDEAGLRAALAQTDVVFNCVGPYYHFGVPILRAALQARRPYLDINDDWEPTLEMLELDEVARKAGVPALVGLGASPGISNLLAVLAVRELDRVEVLHSFWGVGEGGVAGAFAELRAGEGGSFGAATEHWVHQLTGTIRVLREGALVAARPLEPVTLDYPGIGSVTCHRVGHPEPVTFARSFPDLRSSMNLMDMPRAVVDLVRDAAERVERGECSVADAARRIEARLSSPGRLFFSRTGLGLLVEWVRGARHLPEIGVLAEGERDGRRLRVGVGLTAVPAGGMGGVTGIPAAIGLGLLGRGEVKRAGVSPPEQAVEPDAFFEALAPHCAPLPPGDRIPVRVTRAPA